MRTVKGLQTGCLTGVAIGLLLACIGGAQAQVSDPEKRFTTERPGSILIFPKVVWTDTTNTEIQITNTSNVLVHATCFYVDGRTINGVPLWQITDFHIALTRQQPTQWSACDGRGVNPTDGLPTSGLDPGAIPPVARGFQGGLVCVQTHQDGSPNGNANALKGEATVGEENGVPNGGSLLVSVSKYNAVAIQGIDADGDDDLRLDNVEFAACPSGAYLNFVPEGSEDEAINHLTLAPSAVSTTLAFMPCAMDFENLVPGRTVLSFTFRDEFETGDSLVPINVECWTPFNLGDAPVTPGFSSAYWHARIEATETGPGGGGFVGVANVRRVAANGGVATSANNLHFIGNSATGTCQLSGADCADNGDCPGADDFCVRNFGGRCETAPAENCLADEDCPSPCVSGMCQDAVPNACTSPAQCGDALAGSGVCAAPTIRLPLLF